VNIVSAALRMWTTRSAAFWMDAAMMVGFVEPADRRPGDGTSARREPCA
jgi:hypothetical protein